MSELVWYVLFCRTCDEQSGRDLPVPFETASERWKQLTPKTRRLLLKMVAHLKH